MSVVIDKDKLVTRMLFFAFWIIGVLPFIGQEIISGLYDKLSSMLLLLSDVIIIALGVWLIRNKTDIIVILSFLLLAFVSTCIYNGCSIVQYVNGIRLYIGFLFVIPILRYFIEDVKKRDEFIRLFDKSLYIFLWLQLPCAIIQCIKYGAFDQVGGSLGWMMSGEMSTLVYLISLYFMRKKWNEKISYIGNIKKNWVLVFLLIPSFLNETKISFIYLLLYFFFLLPMDRKFIVRMIVLVPCVGVVMSIMGMFYMYMGGKDNTFSIEFVEEYLFGNDDGRDYIEFILDRGIEETDDGGFVGDLARAIKFQAIPTIQEDEPHAAMLGFGVGIFKGGTVIKKSGFVKEYDWLIHGTRMTIYIFVLELGYLGLLWFVVFWLITFRGAKSYSKNFQVLIYQGILIILIGLYNAAFSNLAFSIIFMYIVFVSTHSRLRIGHCYE